MALYWHMGAPGYPDMPLTARLAEAEEQHRSRHDQTTAEADAPKPPAAEKDAAQAGCTAMTLEVRQDNATANALYLAAGYRRLAALPAYYEDGAPGWRYLKRTTPNEPGSFARSGK